MTTAYIEVKERNTGIEATISNHQIETGNSLEIPLPDTSTVQFVHGPGVDDPLSVVFAGEESNVFPGDQRPLYVNNGQYIIEISH